MQTSWLSNLTLALLIAFASVIAGCGDPQVDTVKEDAREQFKKEVRADGISIHIVFKGDFPGSEEAGRVSGQLSDELWKKRLGTCNSLKSGGQTGDWEIGLSVNDLDLSREVLQAQLKELGLSKDATIYKWRYEPLSMARKFSSISSKNISPQVKRDMRVIWGQYSHFIDVRKRRPNIQAELRNHTVRFQQWGIRWIAGVDYLSADEFFVSVGNSGTTSMEFSQFQLGQKFRSSPTRALFAWTLKAGGILCLYHWRIKR